MDEQTVEQIAAQTENLVEQYMPILLPFNPIIKWVTSGIIRAHYNATRKWPSPAEVKAALPVDLQKLQETWGAWTPSGDGSLPKT